VGRIRLPAPLLSNNGGRVVSNQGGVLVSDQGGAVLSNNGATLLSDRGGGLVSDRGGAGYALRQAVATGPGEDLVAIANAQVGLFDARGEAVRDASGAPLVTTTDGDGRYAFPTAPQDRAMVAVCQLAGTAGQAAALVPKARGAADVDLASSVLASYVLGRFARPQADPQAALERLPAALEAQARQATAEALAQGAGPARLEAAEAVAVVDAVREKARKEAAEAAAASAAGEAQRSRVGAVDLLYEEMRQVMLVAGWSNFGEGQPVSAVNLSLRDAYRTSTGRWWLTDGARERTWEVVDGRLRVLVGSALATPSTSLQGMLATEAAFGRLVKVKEGPDGAPWVLSNSALCRIGADGRLTVLWERPAQDGWSPTDFTDFLALGGDQVVLVGADRLLAVGGAPDYQLPPSKPLPAGGKTWPLFTKVVDHSPDGRIRVLRFSAYIDAGLKIQREGWVLRPGLPPEEFGLAFPADPKMYGADDAGVVGGDGQGTLRFHPWDGGTPTVFGPEVLARWPEVLQGALKGNGRVTFGGNARTLGWAYSSTPSFLVAFGPDGVAQTVFERTEGSSGTFHDGRAGQDGRTSLQTPALLAAAPSGVLYVVDSGVVLSITEGRAEPFAGRRAEVLMVGQAHPGDPAQLALEVRANDGKKVEATVPGFGAGYEAAAREAYLVGPAALRVAADGSVWLLDSGDVEYRCPSGETEACWEEQATVWMVRRIVGGAWKPWLSSHLTSLADGSTCCPPQMARLLCWRHKRTAFAC
jgi:hypothetical protein